jgi:hypothetical protein
MNPMVLVALLGLLQSLGPDVIALMKDALNNGDLKTQSPEEILKGMGVDLGQGG